MSIAFFFFFFNSGEFENRNNDFNFIREFFSRMPDELKKIYDQDKTNLSTLLNELYGKSSQPGIETNFTKAITDFEIINNEKIEFIIDEIDRQLEQTENIETYNILKSVGLTQNSLKLKGTIFTHLWDKFTKTLNDGLNDIRDNKLKSALLEALDYLLSILDSFKSWVKLSPYFDFIKEFVGLLMGAVRAAS